MSAALDGLYAPVVQTPTSISVSNDMARMSQQLMWNTLTPGIHSGAQGLAASPSGDGRACRIGNSLAQAATGSPYDVECFYSDVSASMPLQPSCIPLVSTTTTLPCKPASMYDAQKPACGYAVSSRALPSSGAISNSEGCSATKEPESELHHLLGNARKLLHSSNVLRSAGACTVTSNAGGSYC